MKQHELFSLSILKLFFDLHGRMNKKRLKLSSCIIGVISYSKEHNEKNNCISFLIGCYSIDCEVQQ